MDLDALRRQILTGAPLERLAAAQRLAEAGRVAWPVFVELTTDESLAPEIRVAAARAVPLLPTALLETITTSLLASPDPVLRHFGVRLAQHYGVVSHLSAIERLTRDPAVVWDLDQEIHVATAAREAMATLHARRTGRELHLARRAELLRTSERDLGLTPESFPHEVFGVLMEVGIPPGWFGLVCLGDGRVELCLSDGGGTVGAGEFDEVRDAAGVFLAGCQHHFEDAARTGVFPPPDLDRVTFHFLTRHGVRRLDAPRAELTEGVHALSPLYAAGDALLGKVLAAEKEFRAHVEESPIVDVPAHALVDPDPEGELALMEEMVAGAPAKVHRVTTNLGASFDKARRLLGFRVALGRPPADVVAALRTVSEFGVALFHRGGFGPDVTVTLTLGGQRVEVPGGVTTYTSAPRWGDAVGAAMALRDRAALDSLCDFDTRSFEGSYDRYHDAYARGIIALHRGSEDARELLSLARERAAEATGTGELRARVGVATIEIARAILTGDAATFHRQLVEALTNYRTVHEGPDDDHLAQEVLPLRILGLCALARDRGMEVRVRSEYLPPFLVDGVLG